MLKKKQLLKQLVSEHQKLETVTNDLIKEGMFNQPVFDNWAAKDILSNISAWNWEMISAADKILENKNPWFVEEGDNILDEFNKRQVEKRNSWSVEGIIEEWQKSFKALIERVERVSERDFIWRTDYSWSDGTPVTLESLFEYEYEGAGHEGVTPSRLQNG